MSEIITPEFWIGFSAGMCFALIAGACYFWRKP